MASAAQLAALRQETFWANRSEVNDAERDYYAAKSGAKGYSSSSSASKQPHPKSNLAAEIAKARQHIKNSLDCVDNLAGMTGQANKQLTEKMKKLESENKALKKVTEDLKSLVLKLEGRVERLEKGGGGGATTNGTSSKPAAEEDDDDDVDLFGSDDDEEEESAEAKRVREERLAAYHAKKSKKPALIAKTSVLLDCKPWDDETDMNKMLKEIKTIQMDGLVWGASKLVPVGYGINKLQIICVVEDEKVSIDELQEKITDFEDYVQSCDVAAMNKI